MAWVEFAENIKSGQTTFFRRHVVSEEEYLRILQNHINKEKITDIYQSIFQYSCSDPNSPELKIKGPLYFDFDIENMNENTYEDIVKDVRKVVVWIEDEFKIDHTLFQIFFSGHKGFHILINSIIFNMQYEDPYALTNAYKRIVQDINAKFLDTGIYDKRRVFRIINSVNSKSNLYKVPLEGIEQIPETWADMQEYATQPHAIPKKQYRFIPAAAIKLQEYIQGMENRMSRYRRIHYHSREPKLFPCGEYLLNKVTVTSGHRNILTHVLACDLFNAGYDGDTVLQMVLKWNAKNNPPLSISEVTHTVNSARRASSMNMCYGCTKHKEFDLCRPYCEVITKKEIQDIVEKDGQYE